jgi:hypothetical protein
MLTVSKLKKFAKQLEIPNYSLLSKDELINAISNVENQQFIVPGNCTRCKGEGKIHHFKHVEDGICFACGGSGIEWFDREEFEYMEQQKQQSKKYYVVYHLDTNNENGYARKLFNTKKEAEEYRQSIEKTASDRYKYLCYLVYEKMNDLYESVIRDYYCEYKKMLKYEEETLEDMSDIMTDEQRQKHFNKITNYGKILKHLQKEGKFKN